MLAEQELSILGQAALAYAERRWPVAPLHSAMRLEETARCTCGRKGCESPGKHPRTPHGIHDATLDPEQVVAWWTRWPGAAIALATGPAANVWVLDVDAKLPGNDGTEQVLSGLAALAVLEQIHGALPPTLTSATGGGGRHLFFRWPEVRVIRNKQKLPGPVGQKTSLDVRGDGGYVVLPPSPHASGADYRWLDERDAVEAPGWLLDLVDPPGASTPAVVAESLFDPSAYRDSDPDSGPVTEEERQRRYGAGVLDGACRRIAEAGKGSRHATLNRETFIVGQYVAGGVINAQWARAALEQAGIAAGKPAKEVRATVGDALQKGMAADPRHVPPPTRPVYATTPSGEPVVEIAEARSRQSILRRLHRTADRRTRENGDLILGLPKPTLENAVRILRDDPMFSGRLSFDLFASKPLLDGKEVTDKDLVTIRHDIDRAYRCSLRQDMANDAVDLVASDNEVDPLQGYLNSLKWDGTERLDSWLATYMGVPFTELTHAYAVRWMVSAVARAFEPGCEAHLVLTLRGEQYAGKSRVCKILAGEPDWFLDEAIDIRSKDSAFAIEGRWIVELAEMASVTKRDIETVKAFITRPVDKQRRPYARKLTSMPRRCVFVASTNAKQFLADPSGSRRFAVVDTADVLSLTELERDRDQLWAEAVVAYRNGVQWHITRDELLLQREANASYETEDPWADLVRAHLRQNAFSEPTSSDLLKEAIGLDGRTMDRGSTMRLGHVMRSLGYDRVRARNGSALEWRYRRTPEA